MKIKSLQRERERLKNTLANYRGKIHHLEKRVVSAMRRYKEAVDKERMDAAKKRNLRIQKKKP